MISVRDAVDRLVVRTGEIIHSMSWEDRYVYGNWLAQTFYMVNHSTRLVALAGSYTDIDDDLVHRRFVDHSVEERGHQNIAIADIKALGLKLIDFPKFYQSTAMHQIQYYWIQHRGAYSFFGYTLALETIAQKFGKHIWDRAENAHGKKASNFIRIHSCDDVEHIASAYKHIDKLNKEQTALVLENLEVSCELYQDMMTRVANYRHAESAASSTIAA